jgi:predicted RNase H-like HicB family nuclease
MTEPPYEIVIYWSGVDGAFVAEVPELAGCAADGQTRREALQYAELAIREWLDVARELGRPIPSPLARHASARAPGLAHSRP